MRGWQCAELGREGSARAGWSKHRRTWFDRISLCVISNDGPSGVCSFSLKLALVSNICPQLHSASGSSDVSNGSNYPQTAQCRRARAQVTSLHIYTYTSLPAASCAAI
jgi:hypothetical protein